MSGENTEIYKSLPDWKFNQIPPE